MRLRAILFVIGACLLAFPAATFATRAEQARPSYTLNGTVIAPGTRAPVPGHLIRLRGPDVSFGDLLNGRKVTEATTDAAGPGRQHSSRPSPSSIDARPTF